MKKTVAVLALLITFAGMLPLTIGDSAATDQPSLVTLDVCTSSGGAVSSGGDLPALQEALFCLPLPESAPAPTVSYHACPPLVSLSLHDRPPIV